MFRTRNEVDATAVRELCEVRPEPHARLPGPEYERHAVVHRYDAGVRMSGDDGEATVLLDGREKEGAGAREAEAVLAADGPAGPLADGPLGGARLVEGAHRDEAAALCDGLGPHAPTAATELLER